jgi:hypothetical protein
MVAGCKSGGPPDSRQVLTFPPDSPNSVAKAKAVPAKGVLVKGPGYVGVIFPADTKPIPGLYPANTSFWTPSESDILSLEKGLRPFLEKSKNPDAPEVLKKIDVYKRQYRGIVVAGRKQI